MPTTTSNFILSKPLVNDPIDEDLWGGLLNTNFDSLDSYLKRTASTKSSSFTVGSLSEFGYIYLVDTSSGNITATLPAASDVFNGFVVSFVVTDNANTLTIDPNGSETIDGSTTKNVGINATIVCDGSNWFTRGSSFDVATTSEAQGLSVNDKIITPSSLGQVTATTSRIGLAELATTAETLAGSDTSKIITAGAFAGNKSLSSDGYYKFPGGLTLQWGVKGSAFLANSSHTWNFPTSFSSVCTFAGGFKVLSTPVNDSLNLESNPTTSSVTFRNGGTGATDLFYFAIGY